jgi:hypothetical protein
MIKKLEDIEYIYHLSCDEFDLKDDEILIGVASKEGNCYCMARINDEALSILEGVKGLKKYLNNMTSALQYKYENSLLIYKKDSKDATH